MVKSIHDFQRQCNSDQAFERLRALGIPINRFGFKHIKTANGSNDAYRNGEIAAWSSAVEGESDRIVGLAWRFSATLLLKPYARLEKLLPQ